MHRRPFLATLLAGLITGCGSPGAEESRTTLTPSTSPSEPQQTTSTPTEEQPTPPSATPMPATFRIEGIEGPEQVGIGEPYQYTIAIRNIGDEDGTFTGDVQRNMNGSIETIRTIEFDIPAKATARITSNPDSFSTTGTVTYLVDQYDFNWEIQVTPRSLQLGHTYRTPGGMVVKVTQITLADTYSYTVGGEPREKSPPQDNHQWVFVWLHVLNDGTSPITPPTLSEVSLHSPTDTYEPAVVRKESNRYSSQDLDPGVIENGWIGYSVPETLLENDLTVTWRRSSSAGETIIRWTPN